MPGPFNLALASDVTKAVEPLATTAAETANQKAILAAIAGVSQAIASLKTDIDANNAVILAILAPFSVYAVATSARLVVPTHRSLQTGKSILMATNILDDVASLIPVEFDNVGGVAVPTPTVGSETITNDNAAAVVATVESAGAGLQLVLTPVQPAQDGATANVSVAFMVGTATITTPSVAFVVTSDTGAANAHLRTDEITTRPLPAPGP